MIRPGPAFAGSVAAPAPPGAERDHPVLGLPGDRRVDQAPIGRLPVRVGHQPPQRLLARDALGLTACVPRGSCRVTDQPGPVRDRPRLGHRPGGDRRAAAAAGRGLGGPASSAATAGGARRRVPWRRCAAAVAVPVAFRLGRTADGRAHRRRPAGRRPARRRRPAAGGAMASGCRRPLPTAAGRRRPRSRCAARLGERGDAGRTAADQHQERTAPGRHPDAERKPSPPRLSWHFEQLMPRVTSCLVLHHQHCAGSSGLRKQPRCPPKADRPGRYLTPPARPLRQGLELAASRHNSRSAMTALAEVRTINVMSGTPPPAGAAQRRGRGGGARLGPADHGAAPGPGRGPGTRPADVAERVFGVAASSPRPPTGGCG